jgi:hypothetical protein
MCDGSGMLVGSNNDVVQAEWQEDELHFRNSAVEFSFDTKGALIGMQNRQTGHEYIQRGSGGARSMPFQLSLQMSGGQELRVGPDQMRADTPFLADVPGGGVRLTYAFSGVEIGKIKYEVQLEYSVTLLPNDAESYWEISLASVDPRMAVEAVFFPYIHGIQLSEAGSEDTLLFPRYAGLRVPAFLATAARNLRQAPAGAAFRPARTPLDGLVYRHHYCGGASMPWLDLHSTTNGLYLASYDPGLAYATLMAMADPEAECSGLAISKHVGLASWRSPRYGVGLHNGDWHWGADRYRAWAERHMQSPRVPAWFRRRHALMAHYDFKWQDGTICHDFADIPMLYDRAAADGVDHLFLAGWSSGGFDKLYPEYYPDLELGTMLDFARGIEYIRNKAGFVTLYINAALFGKSSQYADTMGQRWAVRKRDGSLLQLHFFDEDFYVSCRGVAAYQRLMRDTVLWLAKSFGVTGIYLDCFGCVSPHLCYDTGHGHPTAGSWNQDAVRTLLGIEEGLRTDAPDTFTMIEGCGDAFGQYVSAQLIRACFYIESFPEMYRYVYPDHCLVDMVYPSKGQKFRPPRMSAQAYEQLYRSVVVGVFFWFYDQEDARYCNFRTDPEMWEEIRRCLALRESAWPFFAYGRFMDDVGVTSPPDVVAKLYTLEARRRRQVLKQEAPARDTALVAVWNKTGQAQQITVDPKHLSGRDGATDCWRVSVRGLHEMTYASLGCLPELGSDCKLLRIPVSEAKITFVLLERAENESDT